MDNEKIINESDLASVALALPDLPPPAVEADEDHDDPFFAQELNRLTFDERNEVLNDLHGVSDVNNENPEYVGKAISVLLEALDRIPMTEKTAYLIALNQNSSYAHDEKFLLMFLRADRFNVDAAALRVTAFFENKMQLFGREKLGREILYSDLTPDDIAVLESGYAQISPGRDRAGRAILCLMPTMYKIKKLQSKVSGGRDCVMEWKSCHVGISDLFLTLLSTYPPMTMTDASNLHGTHVCTKGRSNSEARNGRAGLQCRS